VTLAARAYIALVIAVGAAALGHGFLLWNPQDLPRFLCYLALAALASGLKVRLPGVTGTMSVLFLFLLAGIVELGLPETLIIGATGSLIQSFWHAKVRPRAVQVVFGVANVAFAITAAHFAYHSPLLLGSFFQAPIRLALAASVFFVTNTFPVAAVITLTEGKPLRQVWSYCFFWSFPYYLVGAAIVGMVSFANRMPDWPAGLLILPVMYVIYRSYHRYLDQLQSERTRAEEERKHAEEVASLHARAMESLAKLDAVIHASPLAILGLDREGNVTSWNTMAERILGWSPAESIGRPLPFAGERSERIIQGIVDRTLSGESVSGMEVTQWRKDGSPFEAAIWTAPLRDPAEGISGVLVTVADVSDRKRLEEQLRLSQKMEAVGRLAGGIAHDFNNLLIVINGYSSMLVDSLSGDRHAAGQAEEILSAGNRAAELVCQLLTFSRRQVIKPKLIEINHLVQDVERMLRRIIGEHIEFRTSLDPEAGWIDADVNQMEAVLLNLATNARDAMPNGGVLSIETARVEVVADRQPWKQGPPAGSYVRLVVRDTGHGMDAETQQHLFEPFFTTKQNGMGTGLGLSSVYAGVQQNRGQIFVESELGKGTTFSIYLPRIESANSLESRPPTSDHLSQGNETILLVEDESAVRQMLREVLSKAGYRVWDSESGAKALEQWGAKIEQIDLLVTDIVMPVMNGLKLAEELRNRCPGLKIIFMSGHAGEMTGETINRQGGSDPAPDLLSKPFSPAVLLRKARGLRSTIQSRRLFSGSSARS